jgi:hypothetical protein
VIIQVQVKKRFFKRHSIISEPESAVVYPDVTTWIEINPKTSNNQTFAKFIKYEG